MERTIHTCAYYQPFLFSGIHIILKFKKITDEIVSSLSHEIFLKAITTNIWNSLIALYD